VAVKTGTSREYHDSWTVGYTPDFLVGVWVGNADNTPMNEITGQQGAGAIWHDVMVLMLNSEYNRDTEFKFDEIKSFGGMDTIEYGLADDDYDAQKELLLEDVLILFPHDGDEVLFEEGMEVVLEASKEVKWYVDGEFLDEGSEALLKPDSPDEYKIKAVFEEDAETINLFLL
jgi:membrane carboxypeptidase/penicillin-binding protein PbpC